MKEVLPVNNFDHVADRNEYIFQMPPTLLAWTRQYLSDQRDAVMLHFMWNVMLTTVPGALLLFFGPPIFNSWVFGLIYLVANYVLFLGRYLLTLHYSQHRRLFSQAKAGQFWGTLGNLILPVFYAPLFGVPSGMYFIHHVVMHHVENNVFPWDVSSTMPYQRDYFPHFLQYWSRYVFAIWFQLPYYAYKRGRYELVARSMFNMVTFMTLITVSYRYNPTAATWVFIVPFLVSSFAMMFGNWSQHIFVDPAEPNNSYRLAYITMNHPSNQMSYNDGYHILHHLNSHQHWSEFPSHFWKTYDRFPSNKALVFENTDVFYIGFSCFTGRLERLVPYVHQFPGHEQTPEQIVALFRERLKPIDCNNLDAKQLRAHKDQRD